MYKRVFVSKLLLLLGIIWGCQPEYITILPKPAGAISRSTVIQHLQLSHPLTPIEGIWVWDSNNYEVAVIKNSSNFYPQYDFVGIITETSMPGWQLGEAKLLFKKTASENIYSVIYFMGDKTQAGTTMILTNNNLMEMMIPTGYYGEKEKVLLIKSYPQDSKSRPVEVPQISTATGFFITKEYFATNYHVVSNADKIELNLLGKKYIGNLQIKDEFNDLAIIKIDFANNLLEKQIISDQINPLILSTASPAKAGDKVFTIGYPLSQELGNQARVSEGIINSTFGLNDDPRMFQISIPIQPGNSGSPLFNESGEVIGIITSTLNNSYLFAKSGTIPQNVNFAVKSTYLKSLIFQIPELSNQLQQSGVVKGKFADIIEKFKPGIVLIEVKKKQK